MDKIQIISITASLIIFFVVVNLVRRRRLKTEYSLIWLIVSVTFIIFSCWRHGIDQIAKLFGIAYAPSVLFIILLVGIILLLIEFSIIISKQAERIKILVQELALLKLEMEQNKVKDESKRTDKTNKKQAISKEEATKEK